MYSSGKLPNNNIEFGEEWNVKEFFFFFFIYPCSAYQFHFHPSLYNYNKSVYNFMDTLTVFWSARLCISQPLSSVYIYTHSSPAQALQTLDQHAFSHPKRMQMHNSTPLAPPLLPCTISDKLTNIHKQLGCWWI